MSINIGKDNEVEAALLSRARELPLEYLPRFLGELEAARAIAWSRLTASPAVTPAPQQPDQLLTVKSAAGRLGVSTDYLYRHAQLPFARRIGRKRLFSARGIDAYIHQNRGR